MDSFYCPVPCPPRTMRESNISVSRRVLHLVASAAVLAASIRDGVSLSSRRHWIKCNSPEMVKKIT